MTALRDQQNNLMGFVKIMRNRTDLKIRTDTLESEIESLRGKGARNRNSIAVLAHELRNSLSPIGPVYLANRHGKCTGDPAGVM